MTYMSRSTRSNSALGLGQHLVGRQAGVQFQVQLAGEFLLAESPIALRLGQQLVLQKLLVILQGVHHLGRRRVGLAGCGRPRRPGRRSPSCKRRWRRGSGGWPSPSITRGGLCNVCLGGGDHLGDERHAGHGVLDVVRLRQRGLRQKSVNAVGDVVVVGPRVFLERVGVLGQPDRARQVVLGRCRSRAGRRATAFRRRSSSAGRRGRRASVPGRRRGLAATRRPAGRRSGGRRGGWRRGGGVEIPLRDRP